MPGRSASLLVVNLAILVLQQQVSLSLTVDAFVAPLPVMKTRCRTTCPSGSHQQKLYPTLFRRSGLRKPTDQNFFLSMTTPAESDNNNNDNNKNNDTADFDAPDEVSDEELLAQAGPWDERVPPYNSIHLTGRIGSNPQPRYFDDGRVVVNNLSLAVRRKYHFLERAAKKIEYGEEETDWYKLEVWGPQAEFVAKYVDKGARVGVIGTLARDEWTDRTTGEPRSRIKVVVLDFNILETKAEAEARRRGRGGAGAGAGYGGREGGYDEDRYDEGRRGGAGTGGFFD